MKSAGVHTRRERKRIRFLVLVTLVAILFAVLIDLSCAGYYLFGSPVLGICCMQFAALLFSFCLFSENENCGECCYWIFLPSQWWSFTRSRGVRENHF